MRARFCSPDAGRLCTGHDRWARSIRPSLNMALWPPPSSAPALRTGRAESGDPLDPDRGSAGPVLGAGLAMSALVSTVMNGNAGGRAVLPLALARPRRSVFGSYVGGSGRLRPERSAGRQCRRPSGAPFMIVAGLLANGPPAHSP
ncbi:hypothetical protein F2981_07060 [Sinorhizobium meliloti]|nr:hypothetical protein [Sinorhizobium meliloti]